MNDKLTEPVVAMVLAMDENRLIGKDNAMPWHIPGELAHFKKITMGKPVIMGRKTFESIGQALPGRLNIVVTRDSHWHHDGVQVAHGLEAALAEARAAAVRGQIDEVFVIGGAGLCRDAMPLTQRFYLTRIDRAFDGDTWLDAFEESDWVETYRESPDPTTTGGVPVHYCVLERS